MNIAGLTVDLMVVLGLLSAVIVFVGRWAWKAGHLAAALNARVEKVEKEQEVMGKTLEELRDVTKNIAAMVAEMKFMRDVQIEIKDNLKALTNRIDRMVEKKAEG